MSSFQQKLQSRHRIETIWPNTQEKKLIETVLKDAHILDSLDKDFPLTIKYLNMLQELKETTDKELKEIKKAMSHQIENISKEIEITNSNQIEILEWKSTITETKNSLEEFSSRYE